MGRELTDKCDNPGCGAVRKDTNHWFTVASLCGSSGRNAVVMRSLRAQQQIEISEEIACGTKCALEIASRKLGDL